MKLPEGLNRLLTVLYLRWKKVEWNGTLPLIDMLRPPKFCLTGSGRLVLGSGVKIFTAHKRTMFQVSHGAIVSVGDMSVLNGVDWIHADKEITIGPHALMAPGVKIIDSNMHPVSPGDNLAPQPVRLGRNCCIGMGSSILPGVQIGDHSEVGAASVVTKNVPPKTVVAGNTARVIKTFDCPDDWIRS